MTADAMTLPRRAAGAHELRRFIALLIIALLVIWTAVPLFMAVMWSLVNPDDPWSPPAVLPPSLSLAQWEYVFTYSEIVQGGRHQLHPGADRHARCPSSWRCRRPMRSAASTFPARRRCASSSCCRS